MPTEPIYLDHAATTPVHPEVREAMEPYLGARFGNPSSMHRWGREARVALDEARERLARTLNAAPDELCFTSGGTEADNLAVLGPWRARRGDGRRAVVTTPIEHKAVLAAVHHAAHEGAEERLLAMTPDGLVDDASYERLVDGAVSLVSVMWVNNEVGVIQPVERLAERAKAAGAVFHTDGVQAFGKVPVDMRATPAIDLFTLSGHKIGAPKGIGAIFIRRGTPVEPLLHGGSQDRGRRPGTENVAAAVGLARAAELAVAHREAEWTRLEALRDELEAAILARVPDAVVHGRGAPRAPHILNVSIPGVDGESLLMALDLAASAVRMSLGCLTTPDCVARVAETFPALVLKARGVAMV